MEEPLPNQGQIDAAKLRSVQVEIETEMAKTIGDFTSQNPDDPAAALAACREAATKKASESTPVKQLNEAADKIAMQLAKNDLVAD